jgi:hypothetical protein
MATQDPRDDLRATEASIQADAERVAELERQKAARDPADPVVVKLSAQVEKITAGLHDKAVAEHDLAREVQAAEP